MKIALFGGAFDPPHLGHIRLCHYILEKKLVDEVWLMPCYASYYDKKMASPEDRLYMCNISILHPKIKVCDFEIKHKQTGETYEILQNLLNFYPKEYQFYFIIGSDNALKIKTWTGWERLTNLVPFIIIPRSGYDLPDNGEWFNQEPHVYLKHYQADSFSSTNVRCSIKNDQQSQMIGKNVLNFIKDKKLYL